MSNLSKLKDECSHCGNIFECSLCRQGHGIGTERENVTKMFKCQINHRKSREEKYGNEYAGSD